MTDPAKLVGSDRVLAVLLELAEHPNGITLDELAKRLDSAKPTVHRALASLRRAGLANQSARGVYELGDEFMRLAFRHQDARPETARIEPLLRELAATYGETAHYAILDGHDIVYRAKVDPPAGAMRLTSTVGGRNKSHSTAVGKLLLSYELTTAAQLAEWIGDEPLARLTDTTIVDPGLFLAELQATRERGYGADDQENEVGVNCVAVSVEGGRLGAISVSGIAHRRGLASLVAVVPEIRATIERHLGSAKTSKIV